MIKNFDIWLFRILNSGFTDPVVDVLMPILTTEKYWLPVYAALFIWLLWIGLKRDGDKAAIVLFFALIVTVTISDQLSSHVLKELFGRLRPCRELEGVRLLVGCGPGKSFPSSHAVNNFAAAIVLTFFYRRLSWLFFAIAALVAYTRVYVGVHYPLDIVGGALIGTTIGLAIVGLLKLTRLDRIKGKGVSIRKPDA